MHLEPFIFLFHQANQSHDDNIQCMMLKIVVKLSSSYSYKIVAWN